MFNIVFINLSLCHRGSTIKCWSLLNLRLNIVSFKIESLLVLMSDLLILILRETVID